MKLTIASQSGNDREFEPYIRMEVQNSRYLIKTVDRVSELKDVLLLRGKIFLEEYSVENGGNPFDIDRHDFQCDHLVIIDREKNEMVGTYRMLCSEFTQEFYSGNEFELSEFLSSPGIKLELGRACIAKEHRRGAVLNVLWRGVLQYAMETNADYLFGCSSVKTESYLTSLNINDALAREKQLGEQWKISPKEKFQFNDQDRQSPFSDAVEIPSLLRSYLGAGAKVYGAPAYDRDFHCLDYLTILKLDELKASFGKKYGVEKSA